MLGVEKVEGLLQFLQLLFIDLRFTLVDDRSDVPSIGSRLDLLDLWGFIVLNEMCHLYEIYLFKYRNS